MTDRVSTSVERNLGYSAGRCAPTPDDHSRYPALRGNRKGTERYRNRSEWVQDSGIRKLGFRNQESRNQETRRPNAVVLSSSLGVFITLQTCILIQDLQV